MCLICIYLSELLSRFNESLSDSTYCPKNNTYRPMNMLSTDSNLDSIATVSPLVRETPRHSPESPFDSISFRTWSDPVCGEVARMCTRKVHSNTINHYTPQELYTTLMCNILYKATNPLYSLLYGTNTYSRFKLFQATNLNSISLKFH